MGGPWVIFGHYLIVRDWLLSFLTVSNGLDKQVVWIRLPRLSEGYYSEFSLRAIGQVIGHVVKIDVHTNAETRERLLCWLCV